MLTPPPLSLYVHLPWCVRKCPYCDFNSHAPKGALPFDDYIDALIRDLEHDLPLVWGRTVHSVFFGGGTPSLFAPAHIDRFLQAASARLRFAPGLEITWKPIRARSSTGRSRAIAQPASTASASACRASTTAASSGLAASIPAMTPSAR